MTEKTIFFNTKRPYRNVKRPYGNAKRLSGDMKTPAIKKKKVIRKYKIEIKNEETGDLVRRMRGREI